MSQPEPRQSWENRTDYKRKKTEVIPSRGCMKIDYCDRLYNGKWILQSGKLEEQGN